LGAKVTQTASTSGLNPGVATARLAASQRVSVAQPLRSASLGFAANSGINETSRNDSAQGKVLSRFAALALGKRPLLSAQAPKAPHPEMVWKPEKAQRQGHAWGHGSFAAAC